MDEHDAPQAVELVRALRRQMHQMTHQLLRLECQHVTGTNGRASAIHREAAALRRDIDEAQTLIDRLQRNYLHEGPHTPARRPVRHAEPGRTQWARRPNNIAAAFGAFDGPEWRIKHTPDHGRRTDIVVSVMGLQYADGPALREIMIDCPDTPIIAPAEARKLGRALIAAADAAFREVIEGSALTEHEVSHDLQADLR
jgi:hypothetical protein